MSDSRPLVVIGTPCFGGLVHQGYMQSVLALTAHAGLAGFNLNIALLGHDALITRARNTIVSAFLDQPMATHLLFIDADITFDPVDVERMLKADKDVVAGMYPLKTYDFENRSVSRLQAGETPEESAMHYVGTPCGADEIEWEGPFCTGVYAGTGFLLIKRTVFEQLIAVHPELRYGVIHAFPRRQAAGDSQYALFDCLIEPDTGIYLSEDYAFCRRWRAIGGKIWLDTQARLIHTGSHNFHGHPSLRYPVPG